MNPEPGYLRLMDLLFKLDTYVERINEWILGSENGILIGSFKWFLLILNLFDILFNISFASPLLLSLKFSISKLPTKSYNSLLTCDKSEPSISEAIILATDSNSKDAVTLATFYKSLYVSFDLLCNLPPASRAVNTCENSVNLDSSMSWLASICIPKFLLSISK